ncbi:pyridoxal-dependent decarboxylase, partial [Streptomyces sp. NRRL F-4489]|uniref:pyridoxal-dependent decarboxylase n=1 Tax=Streptomyces sp. NRRL F-4489 TaxID=1609095 RepID=UPI001F21A4D5
ADLAASALNPSLDSWDQAPAASTLETLTARALAALVYPRADAPDALVTTGGTESNQLAVLLAREAARATTSAGPAAPLRIVCGANAHHSIHRAAWLLGLPEPHTLPTPNGTLDPHAVHTHLTELTTHPGPVLLTATAGTTDSGAIDPLPALADLAASALNPSLDSWDQAPAASTLETLTARALA